jgi:flagellin
MRIHTNAGANQILGRMKEKSPVISKHMNRLASGLRINGASDDAAGLAISEKMRAQIRGLDQASRNIQDGISLIQTAEGALNEVHSLLQRGRELSVQAANDTNTPEDKEQLQLEVENIIEEINGISERTEFNNIKVLRGKGIAAPPPSGGGGGATTPAGDAFYADAAEMSAALNDYMLNTPVQMISNFYGISAKPGTELDIIYEYDAPGGTVAYVSSMVNTATGAASGFQLVLDEADFFNEDGLWISKDRIVAHEMVHAVMGASGMNMLDSAMPKWFKEGAAEYLPGADERLETSVAILGSSQRVVDYITGPYSSSDFYSASYAAVKYLDEQLQTKSGGTQSIKDLMMTLADGNLKSVDTALKELKDGSGTSLYSGGLTAFMNDFKANGASYIDTLLSRGDADGVGSITGSADDLSVVSDASNPVPANFDFSLNWSSSTGYTPSADPMISIWANSFEDTGILKLQIGTNAGQTMDLNLSLVDSTSLGIYSAALVQDADGAISLFDSAITAVSGERSRLGAYQNRLENALKATENTLENTQSAESRIRDVDMAKEMAALTKENILAQAAQSMLAQANQQPQAILQLLR